MKILVRKQNARTSETEAFIAFCFENTDAFTGTVKELDEGCNGVLSRIKGAGDFKARMNETIVLYTKDSIAPKRIVLVGLGKKEEFTLDRYRGAFSAGARKIRDLAIKEFTASPILEDIDFSVSEMSEAAVEGVILGLYRFTPYKTKNDRIESLERLTLIADNKNIPSIKNAVHQAEIACEATCFVRDLVSTPANEMTPSTLAARALKHCASTGVKIKIIEKAAMKKMGMNALLGVARGSCEPPKLIVMTYNGGAKTANPIVLVGKGITFDSGGISLKPSEKMDEMKDDMAGGAVVIAVLCAAAKLKLPLNIIGLVPAAENLPGGCALKPGDVLRSLSGQTIEIKNTDAEGRLILADALEYAQRFTPAAVIDIATLTGACVVALGEYLAGMLGTDDQLKNELRHAASLTGEALWELPLWQEYEDLLKSDIADMKNVGTRMGGTITAALFLKKFAGAAPWAHLDIAGPAFISQDKPYIPKGASGIGARLLIRFLKNRIERQNE
ncbi:MAG: leucyl aminopeptidase [Syntrophales bacterium]|jgi:leucyl aminopeptidase|nr:leucyl aminopeptidase [Syntrophales bacterium]MDY0044501.1 leucyl aminopeptidase [Syntrophales bacterium]